MVIGYDGGSHPVLREATIQWCYFMSTTRSTMHHIFPNDSTVSGNSYLDMFHRKPHFLNKFVAKFANYICNMFCQAPLLLPLQVHHFHSLYFQNKEVKWSLQPVTRVSSSIACSLPDLCLCSSGWWAIFLLGGIVGRLAQCCVKWAA